MVRFRHLHPFAAHSWANVGIKKEAGTDIHEGPPDFKHVASAPYGRNLGFIFVPGKNTWHALGKRPLHGAVRKSLIVNYVTSAWRETSELS